MTKKQLAIKTLESLSNPQNIYHYDCRQGIQILSMMFKISEQEVINQIKEIAEW